MLCPNAEVACPREGVEDWNNGDDWVLPKFKPEPNAGAVPCAGVEPKSEGVDPKPDELDAPKRDGDELAPNAGVDDAPNIEGVADEVDPKGLDVDDAPKGDELNAGVDELPKPELPKAGVLGANGFEDVEVEKGLGDD